MGEELKCKSCSGYKADATYYGHPVDKDGNVIPVLDNWPLCEEHVMMGLIAGWKPTPIIHEEPHKMYGV